MNNAVSYAELALGMQGREIEPLLQEFQVEISKMNGLCVDIGCGPGNVSRILILPKLPSDATVVGIDISSNMIDYARTANADEKRLTFEEMDIETSNLNVENIQRFNNGISFFCLHWIQDLRICYKNIFEMLRPGGTVLINHLVNMCNFPSYIKLAEDRRYKKYMTDVLKFITPLYFEQDPAGALRQILQQVGFEVSHCSLREKLWEFKNKNEREALFYSVNPFIDRIPETLKEEYIQDLLQETLRQGTLFRKDCETFDKNHCLFDLYKYLVVFIKKPRN